MGKISKIGKDILVALLALVGRSVREEKKVEVRSEEPETQKVPYRDSYDDFIDMWIAEDTYRASIGMPPVPLSLIFPNMEALRSQPCSKAFCGMRAS